MKIEKIDRVIFGVGDVGQASRFLSDLLGVKSHQVIPEPVIGEFLLHEQDCCGLRIGLVEYQLPQCNLSCRHCCGMTEGELSTEKAHRRA